MQIIGLAPDGLAPPDIILTLPETLEEAVAQAEENSPLVLAAENLHLSSEKDIDTVFGELLPQVGFFTSVDKAYDPPGGISGDRTNRAIGLEASIPLYEAGAVRSRVRQAKHAANSRYLDIMDAKRQAREAAVRNWEDLMAARAQIDSREAQVKAARIAQEGVKQEAEFGARSVLDALDADQELLDAEVALVVARRDEVVARFALMAALGKLTPETLGFGNDAINLDGNLNAIQRKIFDMDVDRVGHSG
jgi:outer membrane protein TolC